MKDFIKVRLFFTSLAVCLSAIPSFAQSHRVEGVVSDDAGKPMAGVVVVSATDTTNGVATDENGHYSITVERDGSLKFMCLGYAETGERVDGRSVINVSMVPETVVMEDVVIVAYGTQKKVTVTGSVGSIKGEDLMKSPVSSIANALAGKIPGLQSVQATGRPGADDPELFVRGVNSLSASASRPLVLVDGVERSFSRIDPNEIADVTVLKDASATAVFGVRGANGVILITTKRGYAGETKVDVTVSAGLQTPTSFIRQADSYTWANVYNGAQVSDGVEPSRVRFSPEIIRHFKDQDMPLVYPSIDWIDYIMKDAAWQQQYNVNVSGGDERARYFVSAGFLDQDGLFKSFNTDKNTNYKYNRFNYRANVDLKIGGHSTFSANLGGIYDQTNDIGMVGDPVERFSYIMNSAPFSGAGVVDGKHIVSNDAYLGKVSEDALYRYYGRGFRKAAKNVLNLDLKYSLDMSFLLDGLSFNVKGSYNNNYTHKKTFTADLPSYKPKVYEDGTIGLVKSGDDWPLRYAGEASDFGRDWYAETSFNYEGHTGKHDITGLLLYNQSKRYYPGQYSDIPTGYVGLVGRITYNYDTKYLLDLNAGYNGSENFAKGRRYGFFPSASAGWIISSEDFMKNQNVISYLKIRASVGLVGNDNQAGQRFLYLPDRYEFLYEHRRPSGEVSHGEGVYNFGSTNTTWLPGAKEATTGNPDVTWETSLKRNYGFDMKLFNDKLTFKADFFRENRHDILISNKTRIAAPAAQKEMSINFGKVKGWGYELQMTYADKFGDFRMSWTPSVSFATNKIVEMAEIPPKYPWLSRTGHSVGQPFGLTFFELYQPGETESKYEEKYGKAFPTQIVPNTKLKPGDATYVDLNEDGKIDDYDMSAIGKPYYPEYTLALNTYFSWKGFDLSMTWSGVLGTSRSIENRQFRFAFGEQNNGQLSRWIADNAWSEQNPGGKLPRVTFENINQNKAESSIWIMNSDYFRLKNLEFGYTFSKLPANVIRGIRFYLNGTNLLTFSPFKLYDPESRYVEYPLIKVFNLGVKFNF